MYLRQLFRILFRTLNHQYDYVFDWTLLKQKAAQQASSSSTAAATPGTAAKRHEREAKTRGKVYALSLRVGVVFRLAMHDSPAFQDDSTAAKTNGVSNRIPVEMVLINHLLSSFCWCYSECIYTRQAEKLLDGGWNRTCATRPSRFEHVIFYS